MATGGDVGGKRGLVPRSFVASCINKRERKRRYLLSDSDNGSVLPHVIEKVRKHPDFKDLSENAIKEAAENFVDPEYFKDLFSQFSEHQFIKAASEVADEAEVLSLIHI